MRSLLRLATITGIALATIGASPAPRPELAYQIEEGQNLNAFVRDGSVAAHMLLRSGTDPRILVAFPAGNSGVGLWFEALAKPARWALERAPTPLRRGTLNGVVAIATIDAPALRMKEAVLSNVRYLRDYQAIGHYPAEVRVAAKVDGATIRYRRDRLDGAPGYELTLRVLGGRIEGDRIVAEGSWRIRLEITALTGDTPLTPLPIDDLLNGHAAADPAARNALGFLSYREKFMAGSWRFNTYFGRDTLMSVRLLMPALKPAAIEAGLNSVLARLSPTGEVAHEEGISEFALVQNRKAGRDGDAPELDYGMVDDDYMLSAVVGEHLSTMARSAGTAYLGSDLPSAARPGSTDRVGALLVRNLRFVIAQATPFAANPSARTLVAIRPGRMSGNWRDSDEGLGRGRYAYDINVALVPAALEAADRLLRAGLLDTYLTPADRDAFAKAGMIARVWRDKAEPLFRVEVPAAEARRSVETYAASVGVPAGPAVGSLGRAPMKFHAISLDAVGKPVRIVNSDEGFELLFGKPTPQDLDTHVAGIMRPFPAGLMTDVGLVVANAAFADEAAQNRFKPSAYHGAVVWSWQQALLAAGIERQLARKDLPSATRIGLQSAQTALWRAIRAARSVQSSELWSWAYHDGAYHIVAFGEGRGDVDESNAAQLWSTVYLGVRAPRPR